MKGAKVIFLILFFIAGVVVGYIVNNKNCICHCDCPESKVIERYVPRPCPPCPVNDCVKELTEKVQEINAIKKLVNQTK